MRKVDRDRSRKNARRQTKKASKEGSPVRTKKHRAWRSGFLTARPSPGLSRVLKVADRDIHQLQLPPPAPTVFLHPFPHDHLLVVIGINNLQVDMSAFLFAEKVPGIPMIIDMPMPLLEEPKKER